MNVWWQHLIIWKLRSVLISLLRLTVFNQKIMLKEVSRKNICFMKNSKEEDKLNKGSSYNTMKIKKIWNSILEFYNAQNTTLTFAAEV